MISRIPKVLHRICGEPMLDHIIEAIRAARVERIYVITGPKEDELKRHVGDRGICVTQKRRLGTAHAVKQVKPHLRDYEGDVLVACGDTPLVKESTLADIIRRRSAHCTAATVLTTTLSDPTGYGRIVRDHGDKVRKIVEEKDATDHETAIREVNTGTYCFQAPLLFEALGKVNNDNAQGEYYLPDVIEILSRAGHEVEAMEAADPTEVIGVNSRRDLAVAERLLRLRILDEVMDQGVTVVDPESTFVDKEVRIGPDTVLNPFTIIRGKTRIGKGCRIGPGALVRDSRVGENVRIVNSVVEGKTLKAGASVGPYAHLHS